MVYRLGLQRSCSFLWGSEHWVCSHTTAGLVFYKSGLCIWSLCIALRWGRNALLSAPFCTMGRIVCVNCGPMHKLDFQQIEFLFFAQKTSFKNFCRLGVCIRSMCTDNGQLLALYAVTDLYSCCNARSVKKQNCVARCFQDLERPVRLKRGSPALRTPITVLYPPYQSPAFQVRETWGFCTKEMPRTVWRRSVGLGRWEDHYHHCHYRPYRATVGALAWG